MGSMFWLTWLLTLFQITFDAVRLGPARVRVAIVSEYLFTGGAGDVPAVACWLCAAGWVLLLVVLLAMALCRRRE